jgi:hypothetical protein
MLCSSATGPDRAKGPPQQGQQRASLLSLSVSSLLSTPLKSSQSIARSPLRDHLCRSHNHTRSVKCARRARCLWAQQSYLLVVQESLRHRGSKGPPFVMRVALLSLHTPQKSWKQHSDASIEFQILGKGVPTLDLRGAGFWATGGPIGATPVHPPRALTENSGRTSRG